jgi:hypothetical protein
MGSKEAREEAAEAKKAKETKAKEKARKEDKARDKETNAELFKGLVTLSIMPPVDLDQLKRLEEALHESPDLRLVVISGSVANGNEMVVSADDAVPLVDILMTMPPVAQVNKKGKTLQITMKPE